MERTGLLPGAKSPYLKDYAERWLEEYRLNVKPTTYRTRAGRIHACMEVIGCIRLTELTLTISANACACFPNGSRPPRSRTIS